MKKSIALFVFAAALFSCEERTEKAENSRGIPGPEKVEALAPVSLEEQEAELKGKGYQTFKYEDADTTYLMQQYYIAFLKSGENRSQDSLETAQLMEQHLAHLSRMSREGYASLIGPMGDEGEIRGIAVYNTATLQEADSLAKLDPMVQAGRLEVEVRPWWTAKGGSLK